MTSHDNGWEKSADAWVELMKVGDPNRVLLLDALLLDLCGEVKDLDVLDVGCGEGRLCRMLASRGARTIGIEPTKALLAHARTQQPRGVFHPCGAEHLPLATESIDLVVSCVTLTDIADFRSAIREMTRVLRPGGRCVIANLNGFTTAAAPGWVRTETGEKRHWAIDDYMIERPVRAEWAGISVQNWHRPLSAYMKALLEGGLTLEYFEEPLPTPAAVASRPCMADLLRVPHFHVMVWRKGSSGRPPDRVEAHRA